MTEQTHRRKIGETRFEVCEVEKGFYTPAGCKNDDELIEVSRKPTLLVRVETLNYEYVASRQNPGWHLQGWREPTPEEAATWEAKHKSWFEKRTGDTQTCAEEKQEGFEHWWQWLWYRFWHPFACRRALPSAKVVKG